MYGGQDPDAAWWRVATCELLTLQGSADSSVSEGVRLE